MLSILTEVISAVGDSLWASGSKFIPPEEPDPAFAEIFDKIAELTAETSDTEETEDKKDENNDEIVENINESEEPKNENDPEVDVSEVDVPQEEVKSLEEIRKEQDDLLILSFKAAVKRKLQPNKVK